MSRGPLQLVLLACLLPVVLAAAAEPRSAAGKKVISFGWDMPSALLLSEKVREIEATGIDGVALTFFDRRRDSQGNLKKRDLRHWWVHSQPLEIAAIQPGIDALKATGFGRLKHNAVCDEFPEIQILLIPGGRYRAEHDHRDSLCMAFTDGILMGLGPQASLHDGQENAYDMSRHKRFVALKQTTREHGLKYSAVPELYRERMKYGFGIWLDHRSTSYGGWHSDPYLNHFSARDFEDALYNSLYESDGYVWVYTEKAMMWAGDWRKHKKPNVPEPYYAANVCIGLYKKGRLDNIRVSRGE